MKNLLLFFTFFSLVLFQATVLNSVAIFSIKPDLCLIMVIAIALYKGEIEGARAGLWAGLAHDLLFASTFGIAVFTKVITGYVLGFSKHKFFHENILVLIFLLLFGSVFHEIVHYLTLIFLGYDYSLAAVFRGIVLPVSLLNTLLAPFAFWGVKKLYSPLPYLNERYGR